MTAPALGPGQIDGGIDIGAVSRLERLDAATATALVAAAGERPGMRERVLAALREAQVLAADPVSFRDEVRWPAIAAILAAHGPQRIHVGDGLVFEVHGEDRIERALLLSDAERPDHVWEPQTTRLLCALGAGSADVVIGGAFIGDQALPVSRVMQASGRVHAFEPMAVSAGRLRRNVALSGAANVIVRQAALWSRSEACVVIDGPLALASTSEIEEPHAGTAVDAIALDDYVGSRRIKKVALIALDLEGGEHEALRGAERVLADHGPHVVFELHRNHVDWSDGLAATAPVQLLLDHGYRALAIRDYQDNVALTGPIELVPIDRIHLDGPPHGFNVLASRQPDVAERLGARIVPDVSPKLLRGRGPLHAPGP